MMKIKGKPDVSQFLDGGAASEVPKKAAKPPAAAAVAKRQKLVELPEPIFEAIKDRAYEEFKRTGKRVTDTEIIVTALAQYLSVKI